MGELPTRRTIVRGGSAAVLLALAGCLSDAAPTDGDDTGGSPSGSDADEEDDGGDAAPAETVTVYVGVDSVETFDPRSLAIPPGTTVRFVWASDGHALTVEEQPDDADVTGVGDEREEGYEHEVTLEAEGEYEFAAGPGDSSRFHAHVHEDAHLPTDGGDPDPLPDPVDWTDREEGTIVAGPDGRLVFDPAVVEITPGTTVRFRWATDNHAVRVESRPDESSWEGHEQYEEAGFEHEHRFEVSGTYRYACVPHYSAGMEGKIVVTED